MSTELTHVRHRINVKELHCEKKRAKQTKKPATSENFLHIRIAIFNFRDYFNLVQRAFRGRSITFIDINLVRN